MRLSITQRPQEMLQRRSAFQFMSHRFYDVISFGGRALPAVAQVGAGRLGAMKVLRHCLVLLAGTVSGCVTSEEPFPSEMQADTRATPVLRIEEKIREMVHVSRDWEMAQFRAYRQQDIDGDRVDDAILLTTFEHGNYWRRELFVCLSSCPTTVLHTNLGGKGEREADDLDIKDRTIIIRGKRYVDGDAMCCPSLPYESIFVVAGRKIVERR